MPTLPSLGTCRQTSQTLRTCVISSQTPHFPWPENLTPPLGNHPLFSPQVNGPCNWLWKWASARPSSQSPFIFVGRQLPGNLNISTSYTAASTGGLHTARPPGMPVWLSHFLASNPSVCSQSLRIKLKGRAWPSHCFCLPHALMPGPPLLHAHNADVSSPLDPQAPSATHRTLSLPFSSNSPGRQFPPPR